MRRGRPVLGDGDGRAGEAGVGQGGPGPGPVAALKSADEPGQGRGDGAAAGIPRGGLPQRAGGRVHPGGDDVPSQPGAEVDDLRDDRQIPGA